MQHYFGFEFLALLFQCCRFVVSLWIFYSARRKWPLCHSVAYYYVLFLLIPYFLLQPHCLLLFLLVQELIQKRIWPTSCWKLSNKIIASITVFDVTYRNKIRASWDRYTGYFPRSIILFKGNDKESKWKESLYKYLPVVFYMQYMRADNFQTERFSTNVATVVRKKWMQFLWILRC